MVNVSFRQLLGSGLKITEMSERDFAAAIGVTEETVREWLDGTIVPVSIVGKAVASTLAAMALKKAIMGRGVDMSKRPQNPGVN